MKLAWTHAVVDRSWRRKWWYRKSELVDRGFVRAMVTGA
jgi:hypothetical protein